MGGLFDVNFDRFVAPVIAKIAYILVMIVIAMVYIGVVVTAFDVNAAFGFLMMLIFGPAVALLYLALFRVGIESLLAVIYTAQNTAELVRLQGGRPPSEHTWLRPAPEPPGGGPAYGATPAGPPTRPAEPPPATPPPATPPGTPPSAPPPSAPPYPQD